MASKKHWIATSTETLYPGVKVDLVRGEEVVGVADGPMQILIDNGHVREMEDDEVLVDVPAEAKK